MKDEVFSQLEEKLLELPLAQYCFVDLNEILFLDHVRYICETECPQYGKSWACPPAVGSVEECKAKVLSYKEGFVFTTLREVSDIANLEETLATRKEHEDITREVCRIFREAGYDVTALSTESCAICGECAYPNAPCRHPDQMFPCVESFGILVTDLAEKHEIEFMYGGNVVTWFSMILIP